MEVDGPRWAQQFQQPSLGGEAVLRMRLDERDPFDAREEFGFHPLTDLGLTRVILDNTRTISRVQSRLLVPSSFDTDDGARTSRMQIFGWDMVQRVHGNILECVSTKKFYRLNVAELMQKTWANDMRLGEFKKVKGETSRLEVLQQVNPNAYVLARDVMSPAKDISTFRNPREEDVRNKVAWAHLSLSIEFLNVVNPVTGEEYQQLRWSGRTDYCGPDHAHRNASDMMQGMLRWEMLVIAPAVNLVSLPIE
ncbi:uncharacterized protein PITG_15133 [Phytophthora infestans T30-4]|uniref:Uncharacterized protein n=1 Tax=Phytophthora infestans (strain T30-4) TaxID=403677 RepID=D0NRR0_PHYIT|nr:uncharacterized protein PITG_15133 [Phytophthora infestans T30-4]EEY63411.1 conserved hypothetical protein [Phytophthora infestans T30-4]|eukprot:XP_002898296.1 conserved hypothetical protein [Phytophthora infestans T30-4]